MHILKIINKPLHDVLCIEQPIRKELARIHGKSAHLAKCSQLFKKSF